VIPADIIHEMTESGWQDNAVEICMENMPWTTELITDLITELITHKIM